MELTVAEQLLYSVLQISMFDSNHKLCASASGFIASFCEDQAHIPAIVTNRHVLAPYSSISITFTRATAENMPDIGNTFSVEINTKKALFHPDPSIDLAVLPLDEALSELQSLGQEPFYCYIQHSLIPSAKEWSEFDAVEEVIMAGYPKGLRDLKNNLPIVRRGITATHPSYDFNGQREFLVDMPCFEGCSGSPVFILQQGAVFNPRTHSVKVGSDRFWLLGIQHAIPKAQAIGSIELLHSDDPVIIPKPVVPMYLNLGYIIKSTELLAFDNLIRIQRGL